jgi:hypothetical protein
MSYERLKRLYEDKCFEGDEGNEVFEMIEESPYVKIEDNGMSGLHYGYKWISVEEVDEEENLTGNEFTVYIK